VKSAQDFHASVRWDKSTPAIVTDVAAALQARTQQLGEEGVDPWASYVAPKGILKDP